ncbi:ESX secretion-associated protein EspG [Nocardia sp. NPDC046763]|uniref:ESX secretion-associated protein EspG n=1 Tax=Nocardia sp. NPDC046763 TaxID=3155256 RepID=UPI00341182F6
MNNDPTAIDLNVDAALLLQDMAGIDSYPDVLVLLPNVFRPEDLDRVRAVVYEQLTRAGIIEDGLVHPAVEHWLRCLYRPDVELVARVADTELYSGPRGMLRFSLVRSGETHVLALRYDDHVVIQPIFPQDNRLDAVADALLAVLGSLPEARFDPLRVDADRFDTVPVDPVERRSALIELGASPRSAGVLGAAFGTVVRRAEVYMLEHHPGDVPLPDLCVQVLDTQSGRVVVVPQRALDGQARLSVLPGDTANVTAAVRALVDLLPGGSWFDHSRE